MLLSYDWLSEYVDLDGISAAALAEMLTMAGLEVEGVERHGVSLEGVVVGRVVEVRPHPNADRLTLCVVDLGEGEPVQIVCGAPNVAAGQKVPVATVGTTLSLPGRTDPTLREEVTLSRTKIRGEVSEGMICSEFELGLGEDAGGIMVLENGAPVGTGLEHFLRKSGALVADAVLEVAITPNRPDATSHIGIARDVAAIAGRSLRVPDVEVRSSGSTSTVTIRLDAPDLCPRYVGLAVRGVTVGPSPAWLQRRLKAVGLRPINNVVDVTNYVMYEVGQPLHAFDLARLAGDDGYEATIIVRRAEGGERFETLDDQERALPEGSLLICDVRRPVAIAGVMGGANSEVTGSTTDLLIESAYFDPVSVRKTARALGLQTESSYRFERGADPEIQAWAASRAARLIREVAGGEIDSVLVDARGRPPERRSTRIRPDRVRDLLGVEIEASRIEELLDAIGFSILNRRDDGIEVEIPSFRPDVDREVDVIEEVARLFGYDRIPQPGRMVLPSLPPRLDAARVMRGTVADRLAGLGFRELYANSLVSAETAERFAAPELTGAPVEAVVTANAINRDMAALRPSLLPGLAAAIGYNQNRGATSLRVFEFGHVFGKGDDPAAPVEGYRERESLIIGMSGNAAAAAWDRPARALDFFDLKGVVTHLLESLNAPFPDEIDDPSLGAATAYRLFLEVEGKRIAVLGKVNDEIGKWAELREPLYFAEIDWTLLAELLALRAEVRYRPISRHPEVERDLAVVVDRARSVAPMLRTIREAGSPLLLGVRVFDLYEGERIEMGKKSVAFSLRLGAERTLTEEEIDRQIRRIVDVLGAEHGAVLRS